MFFTSSLKFLNSASLSMELQLNVGCFMMGPLILGPMFSVLAVLAVVMVSIATRAALATACAIYSFKYVCSFAILFDCYCILLHLLRLPILSLLNILCLSLSM